MPNRASDLVWDDAADAPGAEQDRGGLTRARIVAAALRLGDDARAGETAALDARPMSLYTHIASKDDLIALMFDAVSGELLVPEPLPGDWREALRAIARRAHDAYLTHSWMLHAFGRGPRVGPNQLRRAEQSAQALAGLDLDPHDAWTALRIVHEWTMGHALHVITLREDERLEADLGARADPARYPAMAKVFPSARGASAAPVFDDALEVVLDGIERRFLRATS
jgi:hypothetical protein